MTTPHPYAFFINHPALYALSIAGAGGAAVYAGASARRSAEGRRRLLFLLLGSACAFQCVGLVVGTERARRHRTPGM